MTIFKNPGNYFLSIWFDWEHIFNILEVSAEERSNFVTDSKYKSVHEFVNGYNSTVNDSIAIFEYYIIPDSIRNGSYLPSSTIFDQQLQRFFVDPFVDYGNVLKNKNEDIFISCSFTKNSISVKNKSSFFISFSNKGKIRSLIILFDKTYLNFKDIHKGWPKISFECFEIISSSGGSRDDLVKKISLTLNPFNIVTTIQSQCEGNRKSSLWLENILSSHLNKEIKKI